jgi:aminoglycoside phosphotransferase (APT) family kinase protein
MSDTWKAWLANPELTGTTRPETIEDAVSRVTSSHIASCERLFRGEQNEVYAIATEADDGLIVRISRRPQSPFLGERWTIEALRAAGVPTPEVLLVEPLSGGTTDSVCIQRRLPGVPLADLTDGPVTLRAQDRRAYARAAGSMLRRIHSVPTDGYGFLDDEGRGRDDDWGVFLRMPAHHSDRFRPAALAGGLTPDDFDQAVRFLEAAAIEFATTPPRVVHGDFLPKHILVHHGEITGVIDFEVSRGGDGVYDLAMWDVYYGPVFSLEDVLAGYFDTSEPPNDIDYRLDCYRLHFALRILFYSATGYRAFAPLAVQTARQSMDRVRRAPTV